MLRNLWDWLRWKLFPNRDIRRFDTEHVDEDGP